MKELGVLESLDLLEIVENNMEIYSYAYVNFHSVADAERALDTLNNTEIKGKLVNNTNQIQNQHFFLKNF